MKTKIYIIFYTIIISNVIICNNKKKYTMTKLWLMISHMSFMINEWNVPHHWHIILPHHVINDYCSQQLICNDFRDISLFCP